MMAMGEYHLLRSGKEDEMAQVHVLPGPAALKPLTSPLGWKVFCSLKEPHCPMDLSKELGVHEQKIYYYMRKFKSAGLIKELSTEQRHGAIARFYQLRDSALALIVDPSAFRKVDIRSPVRSSLMAPFVRDGEMDSIIIVGSPDPHGPWKARASDACCAIDFALFMGAFTTGRNLPNYKLDVEAREKDLTKNLVLIGGPTVNMVTMQLNKELPIYIETEKEISIVSKLSGKSYKADDVGMINIIENPWNREARILVLAGKRFPGTRATVIAWVKRMEDVLKGNKWSKAVKSRVVKGFDMDGDGIIDSVEFLE